MADKVANGKTSLSAEEVIVRSVQFFSTSKFRATSQSGRTATFQGRPPIPWVMLILTIIGFMMCLVPGIIMYLMVLRKMYRFYNLVVTANPIGGGTEVSITHPDWASKLVTQFFGALPHPAEEFREKNETLLKEEIKPPPEKPKVREAALPEKPSKVVIAIFGLFIVIAVVGGYLYFSGMIGKKPGKVNIEREIVTPERHASKPEQAFTLRAVIDDPDGYTNVRSMKSASSDIVTKVYEGEESYTYVQDGNWWLIRTKDGKIGYIHISRIKLIKETAEEVPKKEITPQPQAAVPAVEEFRLNGDEEILTVLVGLGTYHEIWANKPFLVLSRQSDGTQKAYEMPTGYSSWEGGEPHGFLRLKGISDNTLVRFRKIR